jgi:hypothetical protein
MDDDEARYLIDQYNKYASWHVGRGETRLGVTSLCLALLAVLTSVAVAAAQEKMLLLPTYVIFFWYLVVAGGMFYDVSTPSCRPGLALERQGGIGVCATCVVY